jgi:hypothetical protein
MSLTTDRESPCLKETLDNGQQACYLVLSEEERAKGFVRPVRQTYRHVGPAGPRYPLRDLTESEQAQYGDYGYVQFEKYLSNEAAEGRFWTQSQLDAIGKGCQSQTTMALALAETYARSPGFYGATFCSSCGKHLPVGKSGEFVWIEKDGRDGDRVGT